MPIEEPSLPAIIPPGEGHVEELEAARALLEKELATNEGWDDQGEVNGVQLYSKADPQDAYAVPTVKGEAVIPGITADQFLAVIQLPGMRKRWDPRFETGFMLKRYNRLSYAFYSVQKGMTWLVYPRDICGVQKNYRSSNGEILIVQTSVDEPDLAPLQSGKTRATLAISGWQLKPHEDGLKVTYLVKISLNGSIPLAMVHSIAREIPTCVGRARDVYEALGHAPYVRPVSTQTEPTVIFQTESLSDPGASAEDRGALEYRCKFTTSADGPFEIVYSEKMYAGGVEVVVEGEGAEVEEGEGVVKVTCTVAGKVATVVLRPR